MIQKADINRRYGRVKVDLVFLDRLQNRKRLRARDENIAPAIQMVKFITVVRPNEWKNGVCRP